MKNFRHSKWFCILFAIFLLLLSACIAYAEGAEGGHEAEDWI